MEAVPREVEGIEREGWVAVAIGLAAAVVILRFPFLSYVFSYFTTLVHEMGHAAVGWLYGYPSIPAFDFRYGGGVTASGQRATWLALVVQGLLGAAVWVFRRNPRTRVLAAGLCAAYAVSAWTSLHQPA